MKDMLDVLSEAKEVKPVALVKGEPVYTMEDAIKLANAELMERNANGGKARVEVGKREVTPDGLGYTRSNKKSAVALSIALENRYRRVEKGSGEGKSVIFEIVDDLRAIRGHATGNVYTDNVNVHVVEKTKKGLKFKTTKTISANEFIEHFKKKLDADSMMRINEVLGVKEHVEIQTDSIDL